MMKSFIRAICVLLICGDTVRMAAGQDRTSQVETSAVLRLYIMSDRSSSMPRLNPPETSQAVIHHLLELASLAQQPIEVCVITYGRDGVRVFGDENGKPTAGYEALQRTLFANWPSGEGHTPMDEAFARLIQLIEESKHGAHNVVVNITDGEPQSGRLRPDDFAEIADLIRSGREVALKRGQQFPPAIQQELIRQYEEPLRDPSTKEYQDLYLRQMPLEMRRTLDHAATLKTLGVRVVTVDFAGIAALAEIHEAAGGEAEDLLRVAPNDVISALHDRRITALPRIVQLPTQTMAAEATVFNKTIDIPIDDVAAEAVVGVEFRTSVADLFTHGQLKAVVGGTEIDFDPTAGEPATTITLDAHGNVATASLRVTDPTAAGAVQLRWSSRDGQMSLPEMHIHTFVRLQDSLIPDFRPAFLSDQADGPFAVSATHDAEYVFRLNDAETSKHVPVATVEAVLRSGSRAPKTRCRLQIDPAFPNQVRSDALRLVAGVYDVELFIQLPSGINFSLTLPKHIEVELKNESIAMEIPLAGEQSELVSPVRSHNDFGPLGDDITTVSRIFAIRSAEIDYPIRVRLSAEIADRTGNRPDASWIEFRPEVVTLRPGRAQKVTATLSLPDEVEPAVVDGAFDGTIVATIVDTDVVLPIQRLAPISGVPDDAPVERLTFELKRPRITVTAPYALRDWIVKGPSGGLETIVRVDIDQRFGRVVTLSIKHSANGERTLTVAPSGLIADRQGRSVPQMRLVPLEDCELTQTLPSKGSGTWKFRFEIDDDCTVTQASTGLDIYGDGVVTEHVEVRIRRADPLLAGYIRIFCWCLAGLLVFVVLKNIVPLLRLQQLCTGGVMYVTAGAKRVGLFAVGKLQGKRLQLIPLLAMEQVVSATGRSRPVAADKTLTVRTDDISPQKPLAFEVPGEIPAVIHITDISENADGKPEVCVEVRDGGVFDVAYQKLAGRLKRCVYWAVICVTLVFTLNHPIVLAAAQWVHDAIFFI